MNSPVKLAAYAAGLAVVFAGAAGVGNAVGPVADPPRGHPDMEAGHGHEAGSDRTVDAPKGLQVSQDGYTLVPETASLPAAKPTTYAFRITGPNGKPVTDYTPTHDKDLHLIVVRRDLAGFEHVHPRLGADGTWQVPLSLAAGAGTYRVFADFAPAAGDGEALTLGTDLVVAGDQRPTPLPEPSRTTTVDGYTVTLDGSLASGQSSPLTLIVSKDGRPVTDLQPYLAAYGHLVALRQGDLAYLHVHPEGAPGDGKTRPGPGIKFYAEVPTDGTYRLYLDFKHQGMVHTAEFTATAGVANSDSAGPAGEQGDQHDPGTPAKPGAVPSESAKPDKAGHGH
jgi:hypothetical protein